VILFIDTEFADVTASELVSIALVSDCGRYEFYAERDPLPSRATDFVRSVVYPLLERGARAMPDEQLTGELHVFFGRVTAVARHGKVLVAYDYRADLDLLNHALDGFAHTHSGQTSISG
jgi:3' exoribonuclease, RNase T-like